MYLQTVLLAILTLLSTIAIADKDWPAFTAYSEHGCVSRYASKDYKHTIKPDQRKGAKSIHVVFPEKEADCKIYTHWMDGCPHTDFKIQNVPGASGGHEFCIEADIKDGTKSFWWNCDADSCDGFYCGAA